MQILVHSLLVATMEVVSSGSKLVRSFKQIPGPFCLPVVGNLYLYKLGFFDILKYHEVLQKLYEKYGPVVKEKIGSTTIVHLFDPKEAHKLILKEDNMPHVVPLQETTQLYRKKANMCLGLGNINGEEWKRLRFAVMKQMLQPEQVEKYLPSVNQVARDLVKRFYTIRDRSGFVPNLGLEIGKWTQESAGMVCFDKRLGFLDEGPQQAVIEEVIKANRTVFYLTGLLKFSLPIYKYIPTPKWRKLVEAEDIVVKTAKGYIEEALETVSQLSEKNQLTDNQFRFLLSLLAKENLSRKDIIIILLSLYTDGLSTTSPTVLNNLYCLAKNPNVQEKAYEEIQSVLGEAEEITTAHLEKLVYIKGIVKETFRMYPNGTEISRIVQKDYILSNYHIPAQTNISINMGVHNRSDKYFTNPNQFRPERYVRGEAEYKVHPGLSIPFSLGIRMCAGRRFAEQDMHVLLTNIIRNFRLSHEGEPLELVYNTLLMPAKPLHIRFIPRKQ